MMRLAWTALKFGMVGGLSATVYFVFLFVLRHMAVSTFMLTAMCYLISALVNYVLQSRLTFGINALDSVVTVRYVVMHCICLSANSSLMYFAVDVLGGRLFPSQVLVTCVIAFLSFVMSASWVYKAHR